MSGRAAQELGDRLASLGLVAWGDPVELGAAEVERLCSSASHEGLVALLGAAVQSGAIVVDAACAADVSTAWSERMAWCVHLDGVLLAVSAALADAGIATRVLKGVAVATLDEPDPTWRSYSDVDLLVPDKRLLDAADVLAPLGFHPVVAPVSRRWVGEHAKGITLIDEHDVQVDLHRLLAAGVFGTRLDHRHLFEIGQSFVVGGVELTALSPVHRFLHACYHASLGSVRAARHRRDVLMLSQHVHVHEVTARLGEGWSPTVLADAMAWAGSTGGLPDEWLAWSTEFGPDPAEQAWLVATRRSFRDGAGAQLRALPGARARALYVSALVWPSRAHLRSRGYGRAQHVRQLARNLWRRHA